MNKFITFLYKKSKIILSSVLLLSCLYPLKVNASSISASAETLEISSLFFSDLIRLGFLSGGIFPKDTPIEDFANYLDNDFSITDAYSVNFDDISIYPAPDGWLDSLNSSIGSIYGQNGLIESNSDIYVGHIDNGYFEGDFYCDSEGNLLATDSSMASFIFTAKYGGDLVSNSVWQEFYLDFIENINGNNLVFSPDNLSVDSAFLYCGNLVYNRNLYGSYGYVYFPYGFVEGKVVQTPDWNSQNYAGNFTYYYNDEDYVVINNVWSSGSGYGDYWVVNNGSYNVNGIIYNHVISCNSFTRDNLNNYLSYDDVLNYRDSTFRRFYIDKYNISTTRNNVINNDDFIDFTVVGDGSSLIDITDTQDLSTVQNNISTLDNTDSIYNDSFSMSDSISLNNPALVIPDDDIIVDSLIIPFPDIQTGENDDTLAPTLTYDETIQPELSIAIDSFQNLDVPFIQNLQNRYPFSIPWDIAKFINRFRNNPTPPAWDFDWSITIGANTYTKHFQGDLSDFNSLAEIFRNLILISFIIALCKFSYDHHF